MEAALLELRIAMQDRKFRLISFFRDVQIHARLVTTDSEGTKLPLKRFHAAVHTLFSRCNEFSDSRDNQASIVIAVTDVKEKTSDLLALDSTLSWTAGNVIASCNAFLRVLSEKIPVHAVKPQDPVMPNPQRMTLLNELDELDTRLTYLGDIAHGGIEARRPVVAELLALRRHITSEIFTELEPKQTISAIQSIQLSVHNLAPLCSKLTGAPGFMQRGMPAIDAQCAKIIGMLSGMTVTTRPRGSLSIKP